MDEIIGTASIENASKSAPRIDGPVLRETLDALHAKMGMSREALEVVRDQVTRIMSSVLGAYDHHVAAGEVGPSGVGQVTSGPPTFPVTGLLYGRVQSGKTLAMITATAMAIDNGFRVVVVLTSDNVSLVSQTARRFRMLPGVNVKDSTDIGSWLEDGAHIRSSIREAGLVLITAKNTSHLDTFVRFLTEVGAPGFPALILDDEADQASLDTRTAERVRGAKKGKTVPASTIANRTSEGGQGVSIRGTLPHHIYLQVTATPYALLLQATTSKLRPVFTELLEPGAGYTGSEFFFPKEVVDAGAAPLVYVAQDEGTILQQGRMPDGLADSLGCFLVAAAAEGHHDPKARFGAQNYLCHVSMRKDDHRKVADHVRSYLQNIFDSLRGDRAHARVVLEKGMRELRKTTALPDLAVVEEYVLRRLRDREIHVVNSEQDDADFGAKLNVIIGGNILGRGLTIENLLVTYYIRSAQVTQMDTMLQHARMFGYRSAIRPFMRVFIPQIQAVRFYQIHEAELALRAFLTTDPGRRATPIHVARSQQLRATRTNVLDPTEMVAWVPGKHLYPMAPRHGKDARRIHEEALARVERLFPNGRFEPLDRTQPHPITIEAFQDAVGWLPYDDFGSGNWDPDAIRKVLESARQLFSNRAFLYARGTSRTTLTEGNLNGQELKHLRQHGAPVLCIFRDVKQTLRIGEPKPLHYDFPYIYPEVVFPTHDRKGDSLPAFVFEGSEEVE